MTQPIPAQRQDASTLPAGGQDGLPIIRKLAWVALAAALPYFFWRGIWRGIDRSGDLSVGYSAARAWLHGRNPYGASVLKDELLQAGGTELALSGLLDALQNLYFPTTLPIFLPVALMPWPMAKLFWLMLNVIGTLFIAFGLAHLFRWRFNSTRALGLMAILLALSPIHTTIRLGQTSILSMAALVTAVILERHRRPACAGLAYGFATAIKVQIGLPFLAYLLWRQRWKTSAMAAIILSGLTFLSIFWMNASTTPWYDSWSSNLSALSNKGGFNDASRQGPARHSLINLHYPLHVLIENRAAVNIIVLALVAAAALMTVQFIRGRYPRNELLALSIVAVLCLLVSYHRTYDAVLLALPIAWSISALGTERWRQGVAVLILCADFLLPIQTMLHVWRQKGLFPYWLTDNLFWELILMCQQVWALVLISLVLLYAAARERRRTDNGEAGGLSGGSPGYEWTSNR